MKILYLTPFSPAAVHDHAAAFTLAKFVPRLAAYSDLTVFTPAQPLKDPDLGYRLLGPSRNTPVSRAGRLGLKPGWLRQAWPARLNDEVDDVVRQVKPDVIHAEYLQSAEVALRWPRVVLGLRDNTTAVMSRSAAHSRGLTHAYRLGEYYRTCWFETSAAASASGIVVLSEQDQAHFSQYNAITRLIRPGVEIPSLNWSRPANETKLLVFTGAMWRRANAAVAEMLMKEVMPRVWHSLPNVRLRVVGANPLPETIEFGEADERLSVVGRVPDLDEEMLKADAVVVPTLFGGGIMIKVLRSLALGCPTITNTAGADSVGASPQEVLIGDTFDELASRVVEALKHPDIMSARGASARAYVSAGFGWERAISAYLELYNEVATA